MHGATINPLTAKKGNQRLKYMGHRILAIEMVRALFFVVAISLTLLLTLPFGVHFAEASGYNQYYNNNYNSYSQGSYGGYDNYYGYDNYGYNNNYYDGYNYNSGYYGYNTRRPTCTMTLAYNTYNSGSYNSYLHAPATLTWSSWNATSGYISPDVGSVGSNGSRTVYPYGQQTYSMTVFGQGGSNTCQVTSVSPYVSNYFNQYPYSYYSGDSNYTYPYNDGGYYNYNTYPTAYTYPTYTYPATSYVSLNKVPYTGADFGLVGTSLVWLLIMIAGSLGAGAIAHRAGFTNKVFAHLRR